MKQPVYFACRRVAGMNRGKPRGQLASCVHLPLLRIATTPAEPAVAALPLAAATAPPPKKTSALI